jgi:tubulin-specific chaperone E
VDVNIVAGMTCITKGSRVQVDGHRGTVRYVGELEGSSSGEWLGIEWDRPDRGKHHGKYLGKEYFRCHPMTSGSFIRPSGGVRLGRGFMEVVREHYGHLDGQNPEKNEVNERQVVTAGIHGFHKIEIRHNRLKELREIDIHEKCVGYADDSQDMRTFLASKTCSYQRPDVDMAQHFLSLLLTLTSNLDIERLDIAHNLFNNLEEIAKIASNLPHLTLLDIRSSLKLEFL